MPIAISTVRCPRPAPRRARVPRARRAAARRVRASDFEERQQVAQRLRPGRDLHDAASGRAHVAHDAREIGRHAFEVVERQHDARLIFGPQPPIDALGLPLDVDVFRPGVERLAQDPLTLFLRALEMSAFPRRPARHQHRPPPALQRAGDVGPIDRVEPQLDQVGARSARRPGVFDRRPPRAQLRHRRDGDHVAEQRLGFRHGHDDDSSRLQPKTKKAPPTD